MKHLFTFIIFSLLAMATQAQTAAVVTPTSKDTAAASAILTIKEAEYDFGKIPQGKPVTHIFEIVNNGTDTLKIANVQATCGCTTPEWEKDKVQAPGETTKITVGYNAASEGAFTKPITVTYNGNYLKQLIIKGEVWKTPATSAPENKALGSLE